MGAVTARVLPGRPLLTQAVSTASRWDGTHLELETWQNTPVRFTEVKAKTLKK
jgi:hypothetical protein